MQNETKRFFSNTKWKKSHKKLLPTLISSYTKSKTPKSYIVNKILLCLELNFNLDFAEINNIVDNII
jgi:hypothetical protein